MNKKHFTKKHYITIAKIIDALSFRIESLTTIEKRTIAKAFADVLFLDNEAFDYEKFLEACKVA